MKSCHRCGLPRRRPLLTPDGKTFSFPGFAVRRHRGLLLASGAATCCCCVDATGTVTGDVSAGSWTGATYTNLDEWPSDDATTQMTISTGAANMTARFSASFTGNGEIVTIYGRGKISGSGSLPSITIQLEDGAGDPLLAAGTDASGNWFTFSDPYALPDDPEIIVTAGSITGSFDFALSSIYFEALCP